MKLSQTPTQQLASDGGDGEVDYDDVDSSGHNMT